MEGLFCENNWVVEGESVGTFGTGGIGVGGVSMDE